MEEPSEIIKDIKKKSSFRRYIIASGFIALLITSSLVYIYFTQKPKSDPASEKIIRKAAAAAFNKFPNELGKEDFNEYIESIRSGRLPDADIAEKLMKRADKKTPEQLTDDDFARIFEIELNNKKLSDISLLEKFSNLRDLGLDNIIFPDSEIPKWMKMLAKLGMLDLSDRFFIDLTPIAKLDKLENLYLNEAQINDINPLEKLINLEQLRLSNTRITNIDSLEDLTNIKRLWLDNTQISDLKSLEHHTNLQWLWLDNTKVSNIKPLAGLTNLQNLNLARTQINDINSLSKLTNLQTLYLSVTQISDVEPLKGCINLKELYLAKVPISDLTPLASLINLEELAISSEKIVDINSLSKLKNLSQLRLSGCSSISDKQVEDLQKALPNLEIQR